MSVPFFKLGDQLFEIRMSGGLHRGGKAGSYLYPIGSQCDSGQHRLSSSYSTSCHQGQGAHFPSGPIAGLDLSSIFPSGLGDVLTVRKVEIEAGTMPQLYCALTCTLASTQPLTLITDTLSIDDAELTVTLIPPLGSAPLAFEVADSGTATAPVTYAAIVPGTVTISGGVRLAQRTLAGTSTQLAAWLEHVLKKHDAVTILGI